MGFRSIVRKTLIDLTGWKRILILIVLGLVVPVLSAVAWRLSLLDRDYSLEMQTYYVVTNFLTISFIWVAGFFLAFLVATNAAGAISKELADGTLLPLVSKPISRRQIVLGKFAAIVAHAILLEAIILVLLAVLLRFMLPIGTVTLMALLAAIPWVMLYSLLVILLFGAISIALSSLIESQIRVMAIAIALVVLVFGVLTISHLMGIQNAAAYEDYHLYVLDAPYHLGNTFVPAMKQAMGGELLPVSQVGAFQAFTGVFLADVRSEGRPAELVNYVRPALSIFILLGISAVALWGALWAMDRKDVG